MAKKSSEKAREAVALMLEDDDAGDRLRVRDAERERMALKFDAIHSSARDQREQLDAVDSLGYHVRLVLDNDEGTYNTVRELVREHLAARDACAFCEGSGKRQDNADCPECEGTGERKRYPYQLGEALKSYCELLTGLDVPDEYEGAPLNLPALGESALLAMEILSTALDWVDWDEIARIYLSEVD